MTAGKIKIVSRATIAAASLALACWAMPIGHAVAFSQIGSEDGSASAKEGIVSVPLPPLEGGDAAETAPVAEGGTGPSVEPPVEGGAAPIGEAEVPVAPAAPVPAAGEESAPGAGTTDEGETELVPDEASPPVGAANEPGSAAPIEPAGDSEPGGVGDDAPDDPAAPSPGASAAPPSAAPLAAAQIFRGEEGLPTMVRDLRARLMDIARAGEIEALRPYIETGDEGTVLTFGGLDGDPIDYLKSASGDGEGVEVLAILLEVLQAGHIRSEPDTDNEIFVWPYFTGVPIDQLTKRQQVELFEIVTAGDYQEMVGFGAYNFYRAGISPDGKLQFFVAGD